jgi:hypothetical protein
VNDRASCCLIAAASLYVRWKRAFVRTWFLLFRHGAAECASRARQRVRRLTIPRVINWIGIRWIVFSLGMSVFCDIQNSIFPSHFENLRPVDQGDERRHSALAVAGFREDLCVVDGFLRRNSIDRVNENGTRSIRFQRNVFRCGMYLVRIIPS